MEHSGTLTQAFVYLVAAVIAVPIARRLGLGSILGYLVAGLIIGPAGLGLVGEDAEGVMQLAEFGIVMMLFLIGLELRPELLWRLRGPIMGLGGLQTVCTAAAITAVAVFVELPWPQALAIGLIMAGSSTAIVLQIMQEDRLTNTPVGRSGFSVMLFQDMAVIPILAALPLLAMVPGATDAAEGGSPWLDVFITLGTVAGIVVGGRFLIRPVFRAIAATRLREIFTAAALLIVVGVTLAMEAVGLSPALGAFLAGVVLATSEYRHELETDIEPFKGLLLGLFFISVGAAIDFSQLAGNPLLVIGLVAVLVLLKAGVVFAIARLFGHSTPRAITLGLLLGQGGEFAFVLFAVAAGSNVLPTDTADLLIAVTALSMAATPLLMMLDRRLLQPVLSGTKPPSAAEPDVEDMGANVIVAGFGRFGQIVARVLMANGFRPTLLDHDPDQVQTLRDFGYKVFYGDATREDLLRAAGAEEARLLVIAIDDRDKVLKLAETAQKHFPHMAVLARAFDRRSAYELMRRGVEYISRETFGSALETGREALQLLGFRAYQAHRAARSFEAHDQRELAELYKLWGDEKRYRIRARRGTEDISRVLTVDRADFRDAEDHAWEAPPVR